MVAPKRLTVGTRGSKMALVQTNTVIDHLKSRYPGLAVDIVVISTRGDVDTSPIPLDTVGKAWFTKEIEQALIDGSIDLAVHSLKDMPPETPQNLTVIPVLTRDDPRDALVSYAANSLANLPKGAIVGTDSLRRKALLLQQRPDLLVRSVRGNANTRLQQLQAGKYDALILAAAGLERIHETDAIVERFDPAVFIPAIGQGTLAVEVRSDQADTLELVGEIQDALTVQAARAEQAFAKVIGGGCKLPVACYVRFENGLAHIYGLVGSMDAKACVTKTISGPELDATALAERLARELAEEPFAADYHGTAAHK